MKHVIIGNGPAGVVAAETLRKVSPDASIALVGDEPEPPYSRMALPYYLVGQIGEEGTYLRKDAAHFERQRINLLRGRAQSVDTRARAVKLDNGTTLTYDRLLVATGSHPIRPPIPGIDLPQVHTCWTLEDARHIARLAQPGARVLQLGAGFIGCIILEALASRGVQLTVVEMGDRMVPRMMTP
ncbi:MAG: NAD(P)/FAD-dependent oxidoreductase, partial [Pseudomonadota bacterium]